MTADGSSGKGELERTLGLRETATIGLGTLAGVLVGIGQWVGLMFASAFTTAALVFTSYLGFAQIATVAGDVRVRDATCRAR